MAAADLLLARGHPIFNLACIERLTLLHEQFDTIWIPSAVEAELRNVPDAAVLKIIEQAKQRDG
jgi:predicted nucleic acid-binding protein